MADVGKQIIQNIGEWTIVDTIFTKDNVECYLAERDIGSSKEINLFKMFKRKGSESSAKSALRKVEEMVNNKGYRHILTYKEGFVTSVEETAYLCVRMEYAEQFDTLKYDEQLIDIGMVVCKAINEWDYSKTCELEITPLDIYKDQRGVYKIDVINEDLLDFIEYGKKKDPGYYSAPEVYKGQMHEESAWVYSLGILLYEIANNNCLPFLNKRTNSCSSEELERALNKRLLGEELDSPCNVSDSLGQVIVCACSYNIAERYSSVIALADALEKNNYSRKDSSQNNGPKDVDKIFTGASEKARKKKRTVLWIIVTIICVILASVAGVYIYKVVNKEYIVPDLVNLSYEDANAKLSEAGLEMEEYQGEHGENYLVEKQTPEANSSVKKKTKIKIEMYELKKDVIIPDIVGNDEEQAKNTLTDLGLEFLREYTYNDMEKGKVISISPEVGQTVKEGDTVNLLISQGKEQVSVPNLIGLKKKEIKALMEAAGLEYNIKEVYDENVEKGVVSSQDVKAGNQVDKGSVVYIEVSKGPKEKEVAAPVVTAPSGGGGGGGGGGSTPSTTEAKKKKKKSGWVAE